MTGSAMRRAKRTRLTGRSGGRPAARNAPERAGQRSASGMPREGRAHTSSNAAETSASMVTTVHVPSGVATGGGGGFALFFLD